MSRAVSVRDLAKSARAVAAAPDYDEREIRDALWAVVDAALVDPAFDPATANTAGTAADALALATAWADGRRSWINVIHADTQERRLEVVAVMDAQEVVKWSALAVALAQIEAMRDAA